MTTFYISETGVKSEKKNSFQISTKLKVIS